MKYMNHYRTAFVLKNFIPEKNKVLLLHQKLGKIVCLYPNRHKAMYLCTGAKIICFIEHKQDRYEIIDFDVMFIPEKISIFKLTLIHEIIMLCLLLPPNVMVSELFDFLVYVYQNFNTLTIVSHKIILLRLFLLFDLLPDEKKYYHYALQDPCGYIVQSEQELSLIIEQCWQRFYYETKLSINKFKNIY